MRTATLTTTTDIEVSQGGQRMSWQATSARGRVWVAAHPALTEYIPEGVECLTADGDLLIQLAIGDGLHVASGDVEVCLC